MGSLPDLQTDHYADTRGLLPRIVEDVFNWTATHPEKCSVVCSYMEVYNEQIFDLVLPPALSSLPRNASTRFERTSSEASSWKGFSRNVSLPTARASRPY